MKIKCEYCGSFINDYDEKCKNCGAQNKKMNTSDKDRPRTIEELKQWYLSLNMPPENMAKIFIGKEVRNPGAIGIYKDKKGNYISYKVNDVSEKEILYDGKDEEEAVNKTYELIKEKILKKKAFEFNVMSSVNNTFNRVGKMHSIFMVIFVIIFLLAFFMIGGTMIRMFSFFG